MASADEDVLASSIGLALPFGSMVGVTVGILVNNVALGVTIGAALGLMVGVLIGSFRAGEQDGGSSPPGDDSDDGTPTG